MSIVKSGKRTKDNIGKQKSEDRKRQRMALDLRQAGATYQEISEQVGYASASSAHRAVQRALVNQSFDDAKGIILMDLQRLDDMQKRATHRMRTKDDLSQIHTILRIMDQRYRLTGVSSETARALAEHMGVDVQATDHARTQNNVMVIQQTETDEKEFISRMMKAANIDPESPEAHEYFKRLEEAKNDDAPKKKKVKKKAGAKKTKRGKKIKIVRKEQAKLERVQELPQGELEEADIVEAEIVEDEALPSE